MIPLTLKSLYLKMEADLHQEKALLRGNLVNLQMKKVKNKMYYNKMKNKKYHTVRTVSKSIRKIVKSCKICTTNTHVHDRSLSWLGTNNSIKSGNVKLVLWAQIFPIEMMDSYKCLPCVSKLASLAHNGANRVGTMYKECNKIEN